MKFKNDFKFNYHLHIGPRIIKTVIAVLISLMIVKWRDGFPFYAGITAIFCMQPQKEQSVKSAINRTLGSLIGLIYGIILIYIFRVLGIEYDSFVWLLIISLALIPIILTNLFLCKPEIIYFSMVVFLSIALSHVDKQPVIFAINRMVDTTIGIVVALIVNQFPPYYKKEKY